MILCVLDSGGTEVNVNFLRSNSQWLCVFKGRNVIVVIDSTALSTFSFGQQWVETYEIKWLIYLVSSDKKKKVFDYNLCLICQDKRDLVFIKKPKEINLNRIREASILRSDKIASFIDSNLEHTLKWHRNCYAVYISSNNIARKVKQQCTVELDGSHETEQKIFLLPHLPLNHYLHELSFPSVTITNVCFAKKNIKRN